MAKILFAPEVDEDLQGLYEFIARDNPEAAGRFIRMADAAFEILASNPYLGVVREFDPADIREMRSFRIKHFESYLVFYRPIDDGIEVLRVMHGARDIPKEFEEE